MLTVAGLETDYWAVQVQLQVVKSKAFIGGN